jgi:hypothetical protein
MTEPIARLLLIPLIALPLAGCASGRAQVLEERPTLVVPPVPPRTIEPPPPAELPSVGTVVEFPTTPPATTTKPVARANRGAAESKPEPKPESPPDATVTAPTSPSPVPALRTPATPNGPDAARQIKETLDRASAMLNTKVDYQKLSEDGKANYNTAKGFIEQGVDALTKGDLAVAESYAKRAENTAKLLLSR